MNELAGVKLHLVETLEDAQRFQEWLGQRRPILGVDTETTGIDTLHDKVRLVQFGDAEQGWTIPWDWWPRIITETFRTYEGRYVFHNAAYDQAILRYSCGITLPEHRIDDTMIMAHVLDSTRYVALKTLACANIDAKAAVAQGMLEKAMSDNKWTWETIPLEVPVYSVYAAMDTVLTVRLWNMFAPMVAQICPKAYDLELAFGWVVMRMRERGMRIDEPYTLEQHDKFQRYVHTCDDWAKEHYGLSRLGSDVEVLAALQKEGLVFTKRTASGARLSLDKEVLEDVIATSNNPLAQAVLSRRRAQKLDSTYLQNFLKFQDGGILRPQIRSLGTRTARMTVTEPALHTLPRRSDDNKQAISVRNCIIPREDHVLVMADWAQIEMRLMAHLGNDEGLRQAFAHGDFFLNISRELYGDPSMIKSDVRRQMVKNGMYALGYGAGAEKIALTTGASLEAVNEFLSGLGMRFPGIRRFQTQIRNESYENERTEGRAFVSSSLTGRRQYADKGKEYALVNYAIQSMAAEILKIKNLEIEAAGLGQYLTMDVHDEVILDMPREVIDDAMPTLRSIMNDSTLLSLPITADVEFGWRWGEKGQVTLEEARAH